MLRHFNYLNVLRPAQFTDGEIDILDKGLKLNYIKIKQDLLDAETTIQQTVPKLKDHIRIYDLMASHTFSEASDQNLETRIRRLLKEKFPKARTIDVQDISGGCGAMFEIIVESLEFKGLNMVKQHRMVNDALKQEIKEMHGLRVHTSIPT